MKPLKSIVAAVLGIAVNKQGKFLLTRRHAPGHKAWHNKWQFPGGAFEFGENTSQALKREFKEELNVVPKIIYPYAVVKTSTWYSHEAETKQDSHIVLICFLVDIGNQSIDLSRDDETNKYGWFNKAEILKLDYLPLTDSIIDDAAKLVKNHHLLTMLQ